MMELSGVVIDTADLERSAEVFRVITGGEPAADASGALVIGLGDAELCLRQAVRSAGVVAVVLTVPDPAGHAALLQAGGIASAGSADGLVLDRSLTQGVALHIRRAASGTRAEAACGARLDHVALLARDLDAAAARWSLITGQQAVHMGLHPVSGGAFSAVRLLLGERMIELVSPEPGIDSPLARRLASHGEGVATLALPVADIEAVRADLRAIDARLVDQPPHWMVHPRDTGGVLVQLTPRVAH